MASLDLKKAFYRVEHSSLFGALRQQNIDDPSIALLLDIYYGQHGIVQGSRSFDISRGVRQGDVISSLLFNVVIEHVFQRWKRRLSFHGWLLLSGVERLTNTRYADDILLYAKSLPELEQMLALLIEELARVGLEVHDGKTKIITSDLHNSIDYVNVADNMIEILDCDTSHKYLGKFINATSTRSTFELQHRIKVAWHAFHKHRRWLLNRNIPIKLRLCLFSNVVTPSALFATSVLSLPRTQLDRLGFVQRKMLCNIVGRVRIDGEEWETTMRRMKQRMNNAPRQFFIMPWELQLHKTQWHSALHVSHSQDINWVDFCCLMASA